MTTEDTITALLRRLDVLEKRVNELDNRTFGLIKLGGSANY